MMMSSQVNQDGHIAFNKKKVSFEGTMAPLTKEVYMHLFSIPFWHLDP